MKLAPGLAVFALLAYAAGVTAEEPPFQKGEVVFLAAVEFQIAAERPRQADLLTRGDALTFIAAEGEEAIVRFAGEVKNPTWFSFTNQAHKKMPIQRETRMPLAHLTRKRHEAMDSAKERPAPAAKLTAAEWHEQLQGNWRNVGWESNGRRKLYHGLRRTDVLPEEVQQRVLQHWTFAGNEVSLLNRHAPVPGNHLVVEGQFRIDATVSPAIVDIAFVHFNGRLHVQRYGMEIEAPYLRIANYGAKDGDSLEIIQKKLAKMPLPNRTWTQPGEHMDAHLLERVPQMNDSPTTPGK